MTITSKNAVITVSDINDVVYKGITEKANYPKGIEGKARDLLVKTKMWLRRLSTGKLILSNRGIGYERVRHHS